MKLIAIIFMMLMALNAKPEAPKVVVQQWYDPVPVQETEPEKQYLNGYVLLEQDGNDVLIVVNGEAVWVTLMEEDTCTVDWEQFDQMLEELDPLPPVPDVPCKVQR